MTRAPRCRPAPAFALLIAGAAVLLASPAHAQYRATTIDSLRVTLDSDWATSAAAPGYLPVRIDITNTADERVIDVTGQGQQMIRGGRGYSWVPFTVRQRVRVPRAGRVRFTMDIPTAGNTNVQVQLEENGSLLEAFGFASTHAFAEPPTLIVATSGSAHEPLARGWRRSATPAPLVAAGMMARVPAPGGSPAPVLDLVLEPERLPTSWLGYASLQAVVIGPREWGRLDAAQQAALRTWIAAGGTLLLVDGGVDTLFPDPQQRPAVDATGVAHYLFGSIHEQSSAGIDDMGLAQALAAASGARPDAAWLLPIDVAGPAAGSLSPVRLAIPGLETVPAGAYLTILVLFSLVIGPVNHLVLKRLRQPALVVLTTPLLAGVFVVLLGGYVVAVEGFSIRGRAVSVTHLDQAGNLAATRATISLYAAGRAPSGGLRFPREAAVFPLIDHQNATMPRRVLDLNGGQRFSSGLLPARVPSTFDTIHVRPARERILVRRDAGALTVTNGLGTTVTHLRYRTEGEAYVLAGPLAPGDAASLQPAAPFGRDLLPAGDPALAGLERAAAVQPDNSYLAVLERSPFVDMGVGDVDERGSVHLVLGTGLARP